MTVPTARQLNQNNNKPRLAIMLEDALKQIEELKASEGGPVVNANKVREVAMALAKEHDWCEVVEGALDEMGIDPYVEKLVDITMTVRAVVKTARPDSIKDVFDGEVWRVSSDKNDCAGLDMTFGLGGGLQIERLHGDTKVSLEIWDD